MMIRFLAQNGLIGCKACHVVVGLVLLVSTIFSVSAQEDGGPGAIYIGAFDIIPRFQFGVQRDDNINQSGSGSEQSSALTVLAPSISAIADDGFLAYRIEYAFEDKVYDNASNNDSTDHSLSFDVDWNLDVRHVLEFQSSFNNNHEERSSDSITAGSGLTALNEFEDIGFGVKYIFGAQGAPGRIELGFNKNSVDYITNRSITGVLDSDSQSLDASFSFAVSPVSSIFLSAVKSETIFDNDAVRNREETEYLLGFQWEFSEITTGSAQLGVANIDLFNDTGDVQHETGAISVQWFAYPYSIWTLNALRTSEDGDNISRAFIDRKQYSLVWDHSWTDNFSSSFTTSLQEDKFINDGREDSAVSTQLQFNYGIRRWLQIGISLTHQDLDSTNDTFDFDKNITAVSLTATL